MRTTTNMRQRGYSLVEVMIVVVLGLVVFAGIAALSIKANSSSDVNELVGEVSEIQVAMRTLAGPDGMYNSIGTPAQVVTELKKHLRKKWDHPGAEHLAGPRGIQISVTPTSWGVGDPAGTAYLIYITQVPAESCVPLARAFSGISDRVYVGQGWILTVVYESPDTPFTTAAAAAACPATGIAIISITNT